MPLHYIPESITPINKPRHNTETKTPASNQDNNALANIVQSIFGHDNDPPSPMQTAEEIQATIKIQLSEELDNNKNQLMYIYNEFTNEKGPLDLNNLEAFVIIVCELIESVIGSNSKENLQKTITLNLKNLLRQKLIAALNTNPDHSQNKTPELLGNETQNNTNQATMLNIHRKSVTIKEVIMLKDKPLNYKLNDEYEDSKDEEEAMQLQGFTQSMHAGAANLTISLLQKNSTLMDIQAPDGFNNGEDSKKYITFNEFFGALAQEIINEIEYLSLDELKELKKDRIKDSIIMSSFMFSPKKGNNQNNNGGVGGSGVFGSKNRGYFGSSMRQSLMPVDIQKLDSKTRAKFVKVQEILTNHQSEIEAIIKKDSLNQKNSIIKALEFLPFNISVNTDNNNSKADFNPMARNQQNNDVVERFIDEVMLEVESKMLLTETMTCSKLLSIIFELFLSFGHQKYLFKKKNIEEEKIRAELHGLDDFLLEDQQASDIQDKAPETLDEQLQATVVQYQKMLQNNQFKNEQEKLKITMLLEALQSSLGNTERAESPFRSTPTTDKAQPHPLRHLASFDSHKYQEKKQGGGGGKHSRNQSQGSSQKEQNGMDDKRLRNLRNIFDFYSKQQLLIGKKPTFDQIQQVTEHMNMGEFIRYCLDFKIPLSKPQIMQIFKKASNNTKELSFQQFIDVQGMLFLQVNIDNARLLAKEIHIIAGQAANSVMKGGQNSVTEQQQKEQRAMVEILEQIKNKTQAQVQEEALQFIEIDDMVRIELKKKGISIPFHTREGSSHKYRSAMAQYSPLQISSPSNGTEWDNHHETDQQTKQKVKLLNQNEKKALKLQIKLLKDKRLQDKEEELNRKKNKYSMMRKKLLTQLEVSKYESSMTGIRTSTATDKRKKHFTLIQEEKESMIKDASMVSESQKNMISLHKTDSENSAVNILAKNNGVLTLNNLTSLNYKDLNTQSDDDFDPAVYGFDKDPLPLNLLAQPEPEIQLQIQNESQEEPDTKEQSYSPTNYIKSNTSKFKVIPRYKSPYSRSISPIAKEMRSSGGKRKKITLKLPNNESTPIAQKFGYQENASSPSEYYTMMSNRQQQSKRDGSADLMQKIQLGGRQQPSQSTTKQRQDTYSPMGRYGITKSQKAILPQQIFYSPQEQTQIAKHQKITPVTTKNISPLKGAQSALTYQQSMIIQSSSFSSNKKQITLATQQSYGKQFTLHNNTITPQNRNLPPLFHLTKSLNATPNHSSQLAARFKMPPRPQQNNIQVKNQLTSSLQSNNLSNNRTSFSKTPLKSRLTLL